MSATLAAGTAMPWLWLVSRGSGLVLLVVLTTVFVLGVATRLGSAPSAWPRFTVAELHRTLALFAVGFLALHVVTAIIDPYVSVGWWATVVPFASHYRTLALGLGTLAVDLGAAVLLTTLVRRRLGYRLWRTVHWLAYLALPVAFVHAFTAGGDMGLWWVAAVVWGSAGAVAVAVGARVLATLRPGAAGYSGTASTRDTAMTCNVTESA